MEFAVNEGKGCSMPLKNVFGWVRTKLGNLWAKIRGTKSVGFSYWEVELKDIHGLFRTKLYELTDAKYAEAKQTNENYRLQMQLLLDGLVKNDLSEFIQTVYVDAFRKSLYYKVEEGKRKQLLVELQALLPNVTALTNRVLRESRGMETMVFSSESVDLGADEPVTLPDKEKETEEEQEDDLDDERLDKEMD